MRARDCKTYYDSADNWTTPTWAEVAKIIDETVTPESDTAQGGSRESEWEDTEQTMKRLQGEITYRYKKHPASDDAVYTKFVTAFLANSVVFMLFLDDASTTTDAEGWRAPMKVTAMPQRRNLGDIMEITVSVRSCLYDDSGTLREPVKYVAV